VKIKTQQRGRVGNGLATEVEFGASDVLTIRFPSGASLNIVGYENTIEFKGLPGDPDFNVTIAMPLDGPSPSAPTIDYGAEFVCVKAAPAVWIKPGVKPEHDESCSEALEECSNETVRNPRAH
jgi:hypothetical protein